MPRPTVTRHNGGVMKTALMDALSGCFYDWESFARGLSKLMCLDWTTTPVHKPKYRNLAADQVPTCMPVPGIWLEVQP